MLIVQNKISVQELEQMAEKMFEKLVKAVIDVDQELMVVDASFHADQEFLLLENGSQQESLWGINLYPAKFGKEDFIVFDSMINQRPSWGNRTRGVDDPKIQQKIRAIVHKKVTP